MAPTSWGLIWNDTADGLCDGGAHLNASRSLPRETGVAQCNEKGVYVAPTVVHCNSLQPSTATLAPTAASDDAPTEVFRFSYISHHADPVLHISIRGNCRVVPLGPSLNASAAALCVPPSSNDRIHVGIAVIDPWIWIDLQYIFFFRH